MLKEKYLERAKKLREKLLLVERNTAEPEVGAAKTYRSAKAKPLKKMKKAANNIMHTKAFWKSKGKIVMLLCYLMKKNRISRKRNKSKTSVRPVSKVFNQQSADRENVQNQSDDRQAVGAAETKTSDRSSLNSSSPEISGLNTRSETIKQNKLKNEIKEEGHILNSTFEMKEDNEKSFADESELSCVTDLENCFADDDDNDNIDNSDTDVFSPLNKTMNIRITNGKCFEDPCKVRSVSERNHTVIEPCFYLNNEETPNQTVEENINCIQKEDLSQPVCSFELSQKILPENSLSSAPGAVYKTKSDSSLKNTYINQNRDATMQRVDPATNNQEHCNIKQTLTEEMKYHSDCEINKKSYAAPTHYRVEFPQDSIDNVEWNNSSLNESQRLHEETQIVPVTQEKNSGHGNDTAGPRCIDTQDNAQLAQTVEIFTQISERVVPGLHQTMTLPAFSHYGRGIRGKTFVFNVCYHSVIGESKSLLSIAYYVGYR